MIQTIPAGNVPFGQFLFFGNLWRPIMKSILRRTASAAFLVLTSGGVAKACSSCGCFLNTDWASQGYSVRPGWSADLRWDRIVQDRSWTGTNEYTGPTSFDTATEYQRRTTTNTVTLGIDWVPAPDWGASLSLPWSDRSHTTLAPGDSGISGSQSDAIGDLRLLGRWQGLLPNHEVGLQLGLKLPTGKTSVEFSSGPQSGESVDAGLQPGTGSTDLLAGMYQSHPWAAGAISHFVQASVQVPIPHKDSFRPGTAVDGNLGLRWKALSWLDPQIQVDCRWEGQESGDGADRDNSGSFRVDLGPGVSAPVVPGRLELFGFVDLPVFLWARGLQLEPSYSVSMGLRASM
jgi:hypothetical protein